MATLLRMPEVAANSTHATLAAWSKKEGDAVAVGDCIAEVETDKAVGEITADSAGVLGRLLAQPGQQVEVGAPIAVLLAAGEAGADVQALLQAAGAAPALGMRPRGAPREGVRKIFAAPHKKRLHSFLLRCNIEPIPKLFR